MKGHVQIGRLAFREEGELWNAYYAVPDSMKGALLLGSLRMQFARHPEHKAAFISLMREMVGDIIAEITGSRPVWPAPGGVPAPEHERGSRA